MLICAKKDCEQFNEKRQNCKFATPDNLIRGCASFIDAQAEPVAQSPAAMAGYGAPEIERIKQKMTEKEQKVLDLIEQYGGIDGAHHKDWLLDQLARILTGEGYEAWVVELKSGEDGPETYSYDEGIAP